MAAALSSSARERYALGQNSEINVTPFVDVMLVLLIIFMVAAPLATVSIKLDLPPLGIEESPRPQTPVFISLQSGGQLFIGDQPTSLERLGEDLRIQFPERSPEDERIYVRADREVRYQAFMRVMNALQDNGFFSVALVGEDVG